MNKSFLFGVLVGKNTKSKNFKNKNHRKKNDDIFFIIVGVIFIIQLLSISKIGIPILFLIITTFLIVKYKRGSSKNKKKEKNATKPKFDIQIKRNAK